MLQDLQFAIRGIWRNPTFALLIVASMAIGIGANTAMFSAIHTVFLRPLPFPDSSRLVVLWESDIERGVAQRRVTPANFVDWRAQSSALEEIGTLPNWTGPIWTFNVVMPDRVERVQGIYASSGFFKTLGVRAQIGRLFESDEDTRAGLRHVIISYPFWKNHFSSDPSVVGRALEVDTFRGGKFSIVGVLPEWFEFPRDAQIFLSLGDWGAGPMPAIDSVNRCCSWYTVFAKLKPGVTARVAEAELTTIAHGISQRHPQSARVTKVKVQPLRDSLVATHRLSMVALFGATGCILLIVCANVSNLLLSRGVSRRKEMLTRLALGAGRWRLARQLLIEGLLLSSLGALCGLLLTNWAHVLMRKIMIDRIPLSEGIRVDSAILLFTLALTVVCGLVCGLAPLVSSTSRLSFAGRGQTEDRSGKRMRQALVMAEVALAVALVVNAGLLVRSFAKLQNVDLGFSTASTLAVTLDLTTGPLRTRGSAAGFVTTALERIQALPGVIAVASTSHTPFDGQPASQAITREGRPVLPATESPQVVQSGVTTGYFGLMGIKLQSGRLPADSDTATGKLVAVINETAAKRYWPNENPIGTRFTIGSRERFGFFRQPPTPTSVEWREVVGVVSDVRSAGFQSDIQPEVYYSHQQFPSYGPLLLVRAVGEPMALGEGIRKELQSINNRAVVTKVQTLESVANTSLADPKLRAGLMSAFSALALLLGVLGIYSVVSYGVAQRTQEIGIRMSLGADDRDVSKWIVQQGLKMTVPGVGIGLAIGLWTTQWTSSLLFGISPLDLRTFAATPILFVSASLFASYLPARRAARVDPATALRRE